MDMNEWRRINNQGNFTINMLMLDGKMKKKTIATCFALFHAKISCCKISSALSPS